MDDVKKTKRKKSIKKKARMIAHAVVSRIPMADAALDAPLTVEQIKMRMAGIAPKAVDSIEDIMESAKMDSDRLNAAKLLLAYVIGTPKQQVALSDPDGGPVKLAFSEIPISVLSQIAGMDKESMQ